MPIEQEEKRNGRDKKRSENRESRKNEGQKEHKTFCFMWSDYTGR